MEILYKLWINCFSYRNYPLLRQIILFENLSNICMVSCLVGYPVNQIEFMQSAYSDLVSVSLSNELKDA